MASGIEEVNGWKKVFSISKQADYWFNELTGESSWDKPHTQKRLKCDEEQREPKHKILKPINQVAIIVPFRDLHAEQQRSQHRSQFIPALNSFFQASGFVDYRIYIIEQSNDKRKFNRGKLLNIGYDIAKSDGYNIFIFHDVDLLPSTELLPFYTNVPPDSTRPVHVAGRWERYNKNKNYFGGIGNIYHLHVKHLSFLTPLLSKSHTPCKA